MTRSSDKDKDQDQHEQDQDQHEQEHEHEDFEKFLKTVPDFKQSRLSSLYSNFEHNRTLNLIGYEANINAWKSLLIKLTTSTNLLPKSVISIDTTGLCDFLTIPIYGQPKNLGNILNELIHRKVFIPNSLYESSENPYIDIINNTNSSIMDYLSLKSWLKWGINSIIGQNYSMVNKNGSLRSDKLIHWNLLVKFGDEMLTYIIQEIIKKDCLSYSSKLFSNLSLQEKLLIKYPYLTTSDFNVLLRYWSRDKSACAVRKSVDNNTVYIKFDRTSELTDDDIGIINIQLTLSHLGNRISQLEAQMSQINFKSVLKLPSKSDQLRKLKQLKLQKSSLIKSLETSHKLWDELNTILTKINDSNLDHEVYQQLISSSKILKNFNNKVSLDDIDNVKLDLNEAIAQENELSQALGISHVDEDYNNEEIENELQKMANDMKQQEICVDNGEQSVRRPVEPNKDNMKQNEANDVDQSLLIKLGKLNVSDGQDEPLKQSHKESKHLVAN